MLELDSTGGIMEPNYVLQLIFSDHVDEKRVYARSDNAAWNLARFYQNKLGAEDCWPESL